MSEIEFYLPLSLQAWGCDNFKTVLQKEIESLSIHQLPLQQGLRYSSAVVDKPIQVMVVSTNEDENTIRAKLIVFYSGVIAGCSCADDPTPVDEQTEQCELDLDIVKASGLATANLLED